MAVSCNKRHLTRPEVTSLLVNKYMLISQQVSAATCLDTKV